MATLKPETKKKAAAKAKPKTKPKTAAKKSLPKPASKAPDDGGPDTTQETPSTRVVDWSKVKADGSYKDGGKEFIGGIFKPEFHRLRKEIEAVLERSKSASSKVSTKWKNFEEAHGNKAVLKLCMNLQNMTEGSREEWLQTFFMYVMAMDLTDQPGLFTNLHNALPSAMQAQKMGEITGKEGGNRSANPFEKMANAWFEGYDKEQAKLAGGP